MGQKCCLPFVTFMDADIVVSPAYIEFGEVFRAFKLMDEVVNNGEGVAIFSCDSVQCPVVLYETKLAILFLDEEDWCTNGGLGRVDTTCHESFFKESVHLGLLFQGHGVDLSEAGLWVTI